MYVIRELNEGDFDDDVYLRDKLVHFTQLNGPAYQNDNDDVLSLFVKHMMNTEGTYMVESNQQRRNDYNAWQYFLLHFEGGA